MQGIRSARPIYEYEVTIFSVIFGLLVDGGWDRGVITGQARLIQRKRLFRNRNIGRAVVESEILIAQFKYYLRLENGDGDDVDDT